MTGISSLEKSSGIGGHALGQAGFEHAEVAGIEHHYCNTMIRFRYPNADAGASGAAT